MTACDYLSVHPDSVDADTESVSETDPGIAADARRDWPSGADDEGKEVYPLLATLNL